MFIQNGILIDKIDLFSQDNALLWLHFETNLHPTFTPLPEYLFAKFLTQTWLNSSRRARAPYLEAKQRARVSTLMITFNLRQLFLDADKKQSSCVSSLFAVGGDILGVFLLQRDYGEMCCSQIKPSAPWSCNNAPETTSLPVLALICKQHPWLMKFLCN